MEKEAQEQLGEDLQLPDDILSAILVSEEDDIETIKNAFEGL